MRNTHGPLKQRDWGPSLATGKPIQHYSCMFDVSLTAFQVECHETRFHLKQVMLMLSFLTCITTQKYGQVKCG